MWPPSYRVAQPISQDYMLAPTTSDERMRQQAVRQPGRTLWCSTVLGSADARYPSWCSERSIHTDRDNGVACSVAGVRQAVAECANQAGLKVEIVVGDQQNKPEIAVSIAAKIETATKIKKDSPRVRKIGLVDSRNQKAQRAGPIL
jgi:hypothetical protein